MSYAYTRVFACVCVYLYLKLLSFLCLVFKLAPRLAPRLAQRGCLCGLLLVEEDEQTHRRLTVYLLSAQSQHYKLSTNDTCGVKKGTQQEGRVGP